MSSNDDYYFFSQNSHKCLFPKSLLWMYNRENDIDYKEMSKVVV